MLGSQRRESPWRGHGTDIDVPPFSSGGCWHLHDYLLGTLGPYADQRDQGSPCGLQSPAVPWPWPLCLWQNPGQLEVFLHLQPDGSPGTWSPSAAVVTGAGLASARSPGLSLGLEKKQHKARSHLPLTVLFLLPFSSPGEKDSVPLLFYVTYCHFSHAHAPTSHSTPGSERGRRSTPFKPEAL